MKTKSMSVMVVMLAVLVVVSGCQKGPKVILRITEQPCSQMMTSGESVKMGVKANVTDVKYQWYFNGQAIQPGTTEYGSKVCVDEKNGIGPQQPTLLFSNASIADAGAYHCVVSNGEYSVMSDYALLSFASSIVDVASIPAPRDWQVTVQEGDSVIFSTVVRGEKLPFRYQWYKDGIELRGCTGTTLTFKARTSDQGIYKCWASDSQGIRPGEGLKLKVEAKPSNHPIQSESVDPPKEPWEIPPTIKANCTEVVADANGTAAISFEATGKNVRYRWKRDGKKLNFFATGTSHDPTEKVDMRLHDSIRQNFGWEQAVLLIDGVRKSDEGIYQCEAVNEYGKCLSESVVLKVNDSLTMLREPCTVMMFVGDEHSVCAEIPDSEIKSYEWFKDNGDAGTELVSTEQELKFVSLTAEDAGDYSVVATKADGSKQTIAMTLQVFNRLECSIVAEAEPDVEIGNRTVCANDDGKVHKTTLIAFASGGVSPHSYQWLRNGVAIPGEQSSTLTVVLNDATVGSYNCRVSDSEMTPTGP